MLNRALLIVRKELVDHTRDTRALASAALYTFMGPLVVGVVMLAQAHGPANEGAQAVLPLIASVFAMIAAFSGGMSVAMDTVAGERERRSLLPLLLSPASRAELVLGKWLATTVFAAVGSIANFVAFAGIFAAARLPYALPSIATLLMLLAALLALAACVAAAEILTSTMCRNLKEAQTWLSILLFIAMAVGMGFAYQPQAAQGWSFVLPIAGHQRILYAALAGQPLAVEEVAVLTSVSVVITVLLLARTGRLFRRDEIIYGN